MKTAIIYKSVHRGNTKKIAEAIAKPLNADLFDLKDFSKDIIKKYDLIGFGSGIYYYRPHKKLRKFVEELDNVENKKAFHFSTSGDGKYNDWLEKNLSKKGFDVIGEFHCKGYYAYSIKGLISLKGLNKGRPDEEDFKNARKFVESLKGKIYSIGLKRGEMMKTAIIYKSIHHGNTKKIAEAMANALEADLFDLKDASPDIINRYDLIGFGSGKYFMRPHKKLRKFVEELDNVEDKKAFIFSTSGDGRSMGWLEKKLSSKGFNVLDEFYCKGFDTFGPYKLVGGMNKGKPNEKDLKNAMKFADSLKI